MLHSTVHSESQHSATVVRLFCTKLSIIAYCVRVI